ncbi:MAG: sulfurtransferase TusA family protein [bacterium]
MSEEIRKTLDIRGTACPMNYVKVMMALEDMEPGERLEVMLDDGKALVDVPRSAKEDGHRVIRVTPSGEGYRVAVEKGGREIEVDGNMKNNGGVS